MPCRNCPSDQELLAFHLGTARKDALEEIAEHLESCARCEAALHKLDDSTDPMLAALRRPVPAGSAAGEALDRAVGARDNTLAPDPSCAGPARVGVALPAASQPRGAMLCPESMEALLGPHRPAPEPAGPTSASLLERLKVQDPEAWRCFLRVYGPLVYEWCRAAGLQADDAADICQDVFRAVARSIGTFQRPPSHQGAFRGWLRKVSRTCVQDHFRRRAKTPQALGGTDFQQRIQELPDLAQDDSADTVAAEKVGIVRRALEAIQPEFAEQTWKAFTQVALDGRSPAEVAAELHMTAFAVRQANYRVRRRLREELCELLD